MPVFTAWLRLCSPKPGWLRSRAVVGWSAS